MTNYEEAQKADHARYARLFHHLLARGHFLAPSGYETLFVSLAHEDEQIDETVAASQPSCHRPRRRVSKHCPNAGLRTHVTTASRRPAADDCGARGP